MSYGAPAKQTSRYREAEVLSASPARLVVIVFEHLLVNMRRARMLDAPTDIAARSEALVRARAALTELLFTLDRDKGGELAERLGAIYSFMFGELTTLGVRPNAECLDALIAIGSELCDAFTQASHSVAGPQPVGVAAAAS